MVRMKPAAGKIAGGAGAGVIIPLATEFAVKGKRMKEVGNIKISTLVGGAMGAIGLCLGMTETMVRGEDADAVTALGASSLVTSLGLEILPRLAAKGKKSMQIPPEEEIRLGLEVAGEFAPDYGFQVPRVREE